MAVHRKSCGDISPSEEKLAHFRTRHQAIPVDWRPVRLAGHVKTSWILRPAVQLRMNGVSLAALAARDTPSL